MTQSFAATTFLSPPSPVHAASPWPWKALRRLGSKLRPAPGHEDYRRFGDSDAQRFRDELAAEGETDLLSESFAGLLQNEGLKPRHTLLDFGCATGRLAAAMIPKLDGGHYIGVDLSDSMLACAKIRMNVLFGHTPCRVTWINQTSYVFPIGNATVDMFCSFSAFTHLEPEDTYRYLKTARRIVKPGGRMLMSCLTMDLLAGQAAFVDSAKQSPAERWRGTRTFTTSTDLVSAIARLSGWEVVRWHQGRPLPGRVSDEDAILAACSTLVLENPARP